MPSRSAPARLPWLVVACCLIHCVSGCYAPLHSHAILATDLPDSFRAPMRTLGPPLNFACLTRPPAQEYLLGPDDVLDVTVPGLYERATMESMRVRVMPDGRISLPPLPVS